MTNAAYLDMLRRRQRKAVEALARAVKAKRGGIGEARARCIAATHALMRATVKAARQPRPVERSAEPDLFQTLGA
jgi:hypothetical protein